MDGGFRLRPGNPAKRGQIRGPIKGEGQRTRQICHWSKEESNETLLVIFIYVYSGIDKSFKCGSV